MPELVIGTIVLAPIIVGIIQALKAAGVPAKYAPWINGVLSVVGFGVVVYLAQYPEAEAPVIAVLNIAIIFLAAAGFYERAQAIIVKG